MASSIINSDDGVISGTSGIKTTGGDDGVLVFQSKGTETARINTDSQIVAAAGTASLPIYSTTGDVNTGIFFPAADTIAFAEGGAEAMRINSSGNVGVGTSTISGSASERTIQIASSTTSNDATLYVTNSDASVRGVLATAGGTGVSLVGTQTNHPFLFYTNDTERMRITNGGLFKVGTPTVAGSRLVQIAGSSAGYGMEFNYNQSVDYTAVQFFRNSTVTVSGSITVSASSVAYLTSSDYRLKENVAPMTGALAKVLELKPCTYTWKIDGSSGQGFVAHELQEIVPDCVVGEKDAVDANGNPQYQGVDTSFLVATLTAAIQELSAKNDALEARIAALEAVPGNE